MRHVRFAYQFLLATLLIGSVTTAYTAQDQDQEYDQSVQAVVKAKQSATLSSQLDGKVEKIHVQEGDSFKKGDVLVAFDCRVHQAELQKAKAQIAAKKSEYYANQRLAKLNAVSNVELANSKSEFEQAQADLDIKSHTVSLCEIIAPFQGNVAKLNVHEHENVQHGQALLEILDNTELNVEAIVPSSWLTWIRAGKTYHLYIEETGREYPVTINKVLPQVDAVSQSVRIIGRIDGNYHELIAGMSGLAKFNHQ